MTLELLLRKLIAREAVPLADALEAQLELTLIRQQLEQAMEDVSRLDWFDSCQSSGFYAIEKAFIDGKPIRSAIDTMMRPAAMRKETKV